MLLLETLWSQLAWGRSWRRNAATAKHARQCVARTPSRASMQPPTVGRHSCAITRPGSRPSICNKRYARPRCRLDHVGILVEASAGAWRTADGGGGVLPDQTASVTDRTVILENGIPILKSPTDGKEKQLDGWVDLDKLEQPG